MDKLRLPSRVLHQLSPYRPSATIPAHCASWVGCTARGLAQLSPPLSWRLPRRETHRWLRRQKLGRTGYSKYKTALNSFRKNRGRFRRAPASKELYRSGLLVETEKPGALGIRAEPHSLPVDLRVVSLPPIRQETPRSHAKYQQFAAAVQALNGKSNCPRLPIITDAELLLRNFRHVWHTKHAAHKRNPRLLGERLKLHEIPKLPLVHLDLCDFVVQHPIAERAQSGLLGVGEHLLGQCYPH